MVHTFDFRPDVRTGEVGYKTICVRPIMNDESVVLVFHPDAAAVLVQLV
jgi:hypothetical protein